MPPIDISKITLDHIDIPLLKEMGVQLSILRLDKIHPFISGNKWFKIKYHLVDFKKTGSKGIITFGGAWSNHILATACICNMEGIPTIGIIRGEKPIELSDTLKQATEFGMRLEFISRTNYLDRGSSDFIQQIKIDYPGYYLLAEGGAGILGEKGIGEIFQIATLSDFTHIACSIGTATMWNGLLSGKEPNQIIIGVPALKGYTQQSHQKGQILADFHFGGYAKYTSELTRFMNGFYNSTGIPTDFVYTAKMMYAIIDHIRKGMFSPGTKICCIHSGGLQGNNSLPKGSLIF